MPGRPKKSEDEEAGPEPPSVHQSRPATVQEAVDALYAAMQAEDLAHVRAMAKNELSRLHLDLGMAIRNNFGLWTDNVALRRDALQKLPGDSPYLEMWEDGHLHPDSTSQVIIEALWDSLRKKGL